MLAAPGLAEEAAQEDGTLGHGGLASAVSMPSVSAVAGLWGGGKVVSWKVSMVEEKLFHGRCGIRILELD